MISLQADSAMQSGQDPSQGNYSDTYFDSIGNQRLDDLLEFYTQPQNL